MAGGDPAAPAGWYPVDGGQQRYWDGSRWTDHVAPRAPQPGMADPLGPGAPAPGMATPAGFEPMPFGAPTGLAPGDVTSDDRTMALLAHLLAIVVGFIGPLIIWLVRKDQSAFVEHHGKESLNFQITMFIALISSFILVFLLLGLLLLPILMIVQLVMPIVAATAANRGEIYRYPFTLRVIR